MSIKYTTSCSQVDGEEMMAHGHGVLIGPSGTYAGLWSQGMQTVGVYTWYVGAKYEVGEMFIISLRVDLRVRAKILSFFCKFLNLL